MAFFNVRKRTPWIKFPDILRISEFQQKMHTVKAMLCITNNEFVCVCGGGEYGLFYKFQNYERLPG